MKRYFTIFYACISICVALDAAQSGIAVDSIQTHITTTGSETCHIRPVYPNGLATTAGYPLVPNTEQDFAFPLMADNTPLEGLEVYEGHRIFGLRAPIHHPVARRYLVTCAVGQGPMVDEE